MTIPSRFGLERAIDGDAKSAHFARGTNTATNASRLVCTPTIEMYRAYGKNAAVASNFLVCVGAAVSLPLVLRAVGMATRARSVLAG